MVLTSIKGQVSIEISILIAVAIVAATIVAYYYIDNVNENSKVTSDTIHSVSNTMKRGIQGYTQEINTVTNNNMDTPVNDVLTNSSGNYNMGVDIPPENGHNLGIDTPPNENVSAHVDVDDSWNWLEVIIDWVRRPRFTF